MKKNKTNKQPIFIYHRERGEDFIQLYDIDREKKKMDDSQSVDLSFLFIFSMKKQSAA